VKVWQNGLRAPRRLPAEFEIVVIDARRTRSLRAGLLSYHHAAADTPLAGFAAAPWERSAHPAAHHLGSRCGTGGIRASAGPLGAARRPTSTTGSFNQEGN